jgi:hypothetical protein
MHKKHVGLFKGILVFILGTIVIPIVLSSLQEQKRVPVMLFEKPIEIFNLNKLDSTQFIGIDCIYGVYPVTKNIYFQKFYFWNNGKKTIEKSDVLKTISMVPVDTNVAISDVNIMSQSRKIIGANISVNIGLSDGLALRKKWIISSSARDDSSGIPIWFNFLEKNDGFIGQIIYIASSPTQFRVRGIVKETKEIRTTIPPERMILKKIYKTIYYMIIICIIILMLYLMLLILEYLPQKIRSKIPVKISSIIWALILMFVFIGFAFYLSQNDILRKESIPNSIYQEKWKWENEQSG